MDQLTIIEKVGANYMLLELYGSINAYTISEFKEKLDRYILDSNVVIDLSAVTKIDSSGMGVIMAGFNDAQDFGTKLLIMNPSVDARIALDKTGFSDTFIIIHSVTEVSDVS